MNSFAERIKFEREKRKMSQKQFALVMDMAQGQYSLIENGKLELSFEKMDILHKKLNIDLNYLVTGKFTKLDYGLDKMDVTELKKLMLDIANEFETRLNAGVK